MAIDENSFYIVAQKQGTGLIKMHSDATHNLQKHARSFAILVNYHLHWRNGSYVMV